MQLLLKIQKLFMLLWGRVMGVIKYLIGDFVQTAMYHNNTRVDEIICNEKSIWRDFKDKTMYVTTGAATVDDSSVTLTDTTGNTYYVYIPASTDYFEVDLTGVTKISFLDQINIEYVSVYETEGTLTDCEGMFSRCSDLIGVDLTYMETANITKISGMFNGAAKLEYVNFPNSSFPKVTTSSSMFNGCTSLASINNFDFRPEAVTDISAMFKDCPNLTYIDLSMSDLSKVTYCSYVFMNSTSIEYIELAGTGLGFGFTSPCSHLFLNCSSLKSIDLAGTDLGNSSDSQQMFKDCASLESVYGGQLVIRGVAAELFRNCSNLTHIEYLDLSNCTTTAVAFAGCTSLVCPSPSQYGDPNSPNTIVYDCSGA